MEAETLTVADAVSLNIPDEGVTKEVPRAHPRSPQDEQLQSLAFGKRLSMRTVFNEFVALVKDNAKVWAICAREDEAGIKIWTFVDSTDRGDRSPVYAAEWQLLTRYPEIPFDFNVLLSPAGSEQLDAGSLDYVFTR